MTPVSLDPRPEGTPLDLGDVRAASGQARGRVPVGELELGLSPRFDTEDRAHIRLLAENEASLPPIVVHSQSGVVIDGAHRLKAAKLLGMKYVEVEYFDGTAQEAFAEAVQRNISHGKPLTIDERRGAALKLLNMFPLWADRRVAAVCGISPKTVARLRERSVTSGTPGSAATKRVGRDGKARPIDPVRTRTRIAHLLKEDPAASLREIAERVGTSQATVLDVRRRLARGADPVPAGLRTQSVTDDRCDAAAEELRCLDDAAFGKAATFATWFDQHEVADGNWETFVSEIPLGRVYVVADAARARSNSWKRFADAVEARARSSRR